MKAFRTIEAGVTLVEVMLVLAIAAAIFIMSIRQYESFRADKDIRQVLYNVDMLAQASASYYWANCGSRYDPVADKMIPGTLSPYNATTPPNPYPIFITTDLVNKGYLPASLSLSGNPYAPNISSYAVQFNQTLSKRTKEACDDGTCATTSPHQIGTDVFWRIQISLRVVDPSKAEALRDLLGADCLSSVSGSTVLPCSSAPANATAYLVFTRAPAHPVPSSTSPLINNRVNVQLFRQPYEMNAITNLTSSDHTTEYQYFVCSGY